MKLRIPSLSFRRNLSAKELFFMSAILSVLLALILPRFLEGESKSKKSLHRTNRNIINRQIELFYLSSGRHPTTFSEAEWEDKASNTSWNHYFPVELPSNCEYGTQWKIDPATKKVSLQGHETHE